MADVNLSLGLDAGQYRNTAKQAANDTRAIGDAAKDSSAAWGTFMGVIAGAAAIKALGLVGDAFGAIKDSIKDGIKAQMENEVSLRKLRIATALAGDATSDTMKSYQDFADTVQRTTSIEGDAVIGYLATANAMGLTGKKAQELVQVSIDLASVTGQDVGSTMESLGKTLSGVNARALVPYIKGLKELSEEQLKAGDGIELARKQWEGASSGELSTLTGAIALLGNAWGDVKEYMAKALVQSPEVIGFVRSLSEVLSGINSPSSDWAGAFANGIVSAVEQIDYFVRIVKDKILGLQESIVDISLDAIELIIDMRLALGKEDDATVELIKTQMAMKDALSDIGSEIEKNANYAESFGGKFRKIYERNVAQTKQQQSALQNQTVVTRKATAAAVQYGDIVEESQGQWRAALASNPAAMAEAATALNKINQEAAEKTAEAAKKAAEDTTRALQSKQAQNTAIVASWLSGGMAAGIVTYLEQSGEQIASTMKNSGNNVLSWLGDQFGSGLGALVAKVAGLFFSTTEDFKKSIQMIFSPELFTNLSANIMYLLTNLPDLMAGFIKGFIASAPQMTIGLMMALEDPRFLISLVTTIAKGFGEGIGLAIQGYADHIKDFGRKLQSAMGEAVKWFSTDLVAAVGNIGPKIRDSINNALKGVVNFLAKMFEFNGGGKGTVEKFLGIDVPWVAFSQGGMVGGRAAKRGDDPRNDTVLAWLSPGEAVIPRSKMADPAIRAQVASILGGGAPGYSLGGWVSEGLNTIGSGLAAVGGAAANVVNTTFDMLRNPWETVRQQTFGAIKGHLGLAGGGIVPASGMGIGGGGGGSDVIVINIDGAEVARAVRRQRNSGMGV